MSNIVPFGKYKGQPVEAMAQDRQYTDWLLAQPWFRDRFQNLHTLVVNNFQEPSETPEHNALQALFLDPAFRVRFLQQIVSKAKCPDGADTRFTFESGGFDVALYVSEMVSERYVEIKPTIGDDYPAVLRQIKANRRVRYGEYDTALFLAQYIGVGVSEEQFIQIFENEGIKVVFLDEVT